MTLRNGLVGRAKAALSHSCPNDFDYQGFTIETFPMPIRAANCTESAWGKRIKQRKENVFRNEAVSVLSVCLR
ncbi:hypothetical protein [Prevotella dentasini]|uniref:hypothetical protein n=1 Tax=Prevotella dentasini TaxID=589537 RepID=UPI000A93DE6C|nr:hypothetical protein [Prevotella dentasini]